LQSNSIYILQNLTGPDSLREKANSDAKTSKNIGKQMREKAKILSLVKGNIFLNISQIFTNILKYL